MAIKSIAVALLPASGKYTLGHSHPEASACGFPEVGTGNIRLDNCPPAPALVWYAIYGVRKMRNLITGGCFSGRTAVKAISVLLFLAAGAAAFPLVPPAADVSGIWDMTVESQQATSHPSITLIQEGEKLTGTYSGQMGESTLQGTLRGNEIRFNVTLKFQDASYVVTYSGMVSEDTMKGSVRFGEMGTGKWSARRSKVQPV